MEVYADAAYAVLALNGRIIGKKKIRDCRAVFKLKYEPGILAAAAYDENDQLLGKDRLVSAGSEINAAVSAEKETVSAGEVFCADISIRDARGIVESAADQEMTVTVEGGQLLGFGSANPRTEESFVSGVCTTYYGRAMAVVRAGQEDRCVIRINGEEKLVLPVAAK